MFNPVLAQGDDSGGIAGMISVVIYLAVVIAVLAGVWKTFTKAGKPGWASIIPIYNMIVMLEIAGKPLWWIILLFIPCVNFVALILVCLAFARAFGKSDLFGIGLALLSPIFFLILGFGDAKYVGPQQS